MKVAIFGRTSNKPRSMPATARTNCPKPCLHTRKSYVFGSICLPRSFGFRSRLHLGKTQPASRSRLVLRQSRSSRKRPIDGFFEFQI